jgi:hypothetical protein
MLHNIMHYVILYANYLLMKAKRRQVFFFLFDMMLEVGRCGVDEYPICAYFCVLPLEIYNTWERLVSVWFDCEKN